MSKEKILKTLALCFESTAWENFIVMFVATIRSKAPEKAKVSSLPIIPWRENFGELLSVIFSKLLYYFSVSLPLRFY